MATMIEDQLRKIFRLQGEYDKMVLDTFHEANKTLDQKISALCTATIHEAVELQRLTSWKWWKKAEELNKADAKEELIDILHFVISAARFLDMTPEEFTKEYERKNQINRERQNRGY